jgi:starch phosphorylase
MRQGTTHHIVVEIDLGRLDPEAVRVELFAETTDGAEPERHVMARASTVAGSGSRYEYAVSVPAARAAGDYTPRLLPCHSSAAIPLEAHGILWQR